MLSLDKMATLEGGGAVGGRVCQSALNLYYYAKCRGIGFLIFTACLMIRAYCPSSCVCGGSDTTT